MGIAAQLRRYGERQMTRRLYRSIPWIGGVFALLTLGRAVQRKGLFRGTLHTVLDFIPFIGGAKLMAEAGRGRDFIPDKPIRPPQRW